MNRPPEQNPQGLLSPKTARTDTMEARLLAYLGKRADLETWPLVAGDINGIKQVVVIPALAEFDGLFHTLATFERNPEDELRRTLFIIVVNNRSPQIVGPDVVRNNLDTIEKLDSMVRRRSTGLCIAYVDAASSGRELPDKGGVGLARKIGLDHGLDVLRRAGAPAGILFSTDADTHVEPDYLSAVREHFSRHEAWAAVVDYAHRLDGSPEETAAIIAYELYLRYHVAGLRLARSPYAFPTIGSTIICNAKAYVSASGMNRRQAGEDFYFLQQLSKTGPVREIFTTTVHPAARQSRRVPFGTGRWVSQYLAGEQQLVLYHPETYRILRDWLALVSASTDKEATELLAAANAIASPLGEFVRNADFEQVWPRLRRNSRDSEALLTHFHGWFDGFKTLKLVHHLRDNGYPRQNMFNAIARLIAMAEKDAPAVDWDGIAEDPARQKALLAFMRADARRASQV